MKAQIETLGHPVHQAFSACGRSPPLSFKPATAWQAPAPYSKVLHDQVRLGSVLADMASQI